MPLEDFLMPNEQIRFHSSKAVHFGTKKYEVILTDKRVILYARRGLVFTNDDVVSNRLDDLQGVKYQEKGVIDKKGTIRIQATKTEMDLWGPASEVKALYQQMMQFM